MIVFIVVGWMCTISVLLGFVLLELFCLRIWSYVNTLIFERFVMDF